MDQSIDWTAKISPRYTQPTARWQEVYNLVDARIAIISWRCYTQKKPKAKSYSVPLEVDYMVLMLGELNEYCPAERVQEIHAFATSPAVNELVDPVKKL